MIQITEFPWLPESRRELIALNQFLMTLNPGIVAIFATDAN